MAFDEQLRHAFDALVADLNTAASAERDRVRAEALAEGRAQGWEDGREHGRSEGRQEIDQSGGERLLDNIRALDRARSLSEILDTVAACAGRDASRAAVFLVRGTRLRGWRLIGFDHPVTTANPLDIDVQDAPAVEQAIASGAVAGSPTVATFAQSGTGASLAVPIEIAGEIVAALYVDDGGAGDHRPADATALEVLGRHASRALEAMVAFKAARAVSGGADRTEANRGADADESEASARRYAKLLVSEIKLYHEPAVVAGRRDRDLATRLGGEIARARVMYEQRVPAAVRERADYFRDELVRTLANGDATLLQLT
jgi:hypothetical protein